MRGRGMRWSSKERSRRESELRTRIKTRDERAGEGGTMKTTSGKDAGRRIGGATAETTGTEIMIGREGGVTTMAKRMKRNAGVEGTGRGGVANETMKVMIANARSATIGIGMAIGEGRGVASIGGVDLC